MKFTVHRSTERAPWEHSDGESDDSLWWSDSEDEEFPVGPAEPDSSDGEADESIREYSHIVHSLIEDSGDVTILSNSSPHRSKGRKHVLAADISNLDSLIQDLSVCSQHDNSVILTENNDYVESRIHQDTVSRDAEVKLIDEKVDLTVGRWRSRVVELEEERNRTLEEERRRKEEERRRQEEEALQARIAKQKEEKRKQEEEEKRRQEADQRAKEEAAAKAKSDAASKAKAEADKLARENAKAEEEKAEQARQAQEKRISHFTDFSAVEKEFARYKMKIADIKTDVLAPVSANSDLRKMCFNAKKKIKIRLGQLTNDTAQLMSVVNEMTQIFNEAKTISDLVYLWLLNFLCKGIVAQAETETVVAVQSAVALGNLAAVCVSHHAPMKELLLARFVKKCPQVIGYSCPIDTEEGRLRMGYKRRNDKWEDFVAYSERIAGICSVWTVMTITQINHKHNQPNSYGIEHSWKFVARQLNKKPELLENADFSAVAAWWDIAASVFLRVYGRQGQKLLMAASQDWTFQVRELKHPAAQRLALLGEDWLKSGQLKAVVNPMV